LEDSSSFVCSVAQAHKITFAAVGRIGTFSWSLFISAVLEGVVLFGVTKTILTWYASNYLKGDGTSYVFKNYQNIEIDKNKAIAKTAAKAAMQVTTYFQSLDPDKDTLMNNHKLFKNLRLLLGKPAAENLRRMQHTDGETGDTLCLDDHQIAAIVRDVAMVANEPFGETWEDPVSLDDVVNLTADETCSLVTLMQLYQDLPEPKP